MIDSLTILFFKKYFFFKPLKVLYKICKNKIIFNSNQKGLLFFKSISLIDELKLTKENFNPNFADLQFLYKLIIKKKISTILEFGSGYSTIVMAAALKLNSNYKKNNKIFTLETERKWANILKKKLKRYKNAKIIHSTCETQLLGMSLCHIYKDLPNITPDLIYVDGPDPDSVKSKIFNLNFQKKIYPISADILLYEYRLKPGAIIIVDGRANNVIFLKNNLKRTYKFQFQKLYNRSIFELLN
jgi:predicted O-methyltransferase YrrM